MVEKKTYSRPGHNEAHLICHCLASLTYYIYDWMTILIEPGWVNQVPFSSSTSNNSCSSVDLHHLPHAHHCFHHFCHLLLHGLHIGLYLLLYLLYVTHSPCLGTCLVRVL